MSSLAKSVSVDLVCVIFCVGGIIYTPASTEGGGVGSHTYIYINKASAVAVISTNGAGGAGSAVAAMKRSLFFLAIYRLSSLLLVLAQESQDNGRTLVRR